MITLTAWGGFILLALLLAHGVGAWFAYLNHQRWSMPLPTALADFREASQQQLAQRYHAERYRLESLVGGLELAALLLFWLLGGFVWLERWSNSFGLGPLGTGLIFIGTLLATTALLGLPGTLYSTFSIENRYGFNRTTLATFLKDRLKGLLLTLLLGGPLLAALLLFFQWAGDWGWLYAWGMLTVVSLFIQYVAASWIMPLFNRFDPLPEGALKERLQRLAQRADFPLEGLYQMDGSRRSSKGNAFFSGFGKRRRIALFDTLIEKHSEAELEAVLAHEIGHYKLNHVFKRTAMGIVHSGLLLFLMGLAMQQPALFQAFGLNQPTVHGGLVFFTLLYSPVEMALGVVFNRISCRHEYEADHYAAQLTDGAQLGQALKRLHNDNLTHLNPHPGYVLLHYSHPPLIERLRALG
ncbi:Ste24 endopeptidase [Magnetococcus marinus MC-1]|uniref:Ste24 endopeptidase n=1 Tax=Magnetococcus marinus (strain ATCC BAA-1437 / JCM 17883 / MC-1) TaxID=156889 RepID=A0L612_MAGMM|nr:M48 family metallopeptidase [Magnetococcus marinus]ABK43405.1 Ste24 endopeptidase [Magnetococcus marinus MC-1]